jgi:hypothetical protein
VLTILEGSTFCICDDIGDVGDTTSGLFAEESGMTAAYRNLAHTFDST